jgi:hypothetical protein
MADVDYSVLAQQARDATPPPPDYAAMAQQARDATPPPPDYAAMAQQARTSAPIDYNALAQQARSITTTPRTNPEGILEGVGKDLSIGFRTGVADIAHTAANVLDKTPFTDFADRTRAFAAEEEPKPEETVDRGGFGNALVQGVGGLVPSAVKYAPAMVAKKWAPLVAGAIEAAGKADEGLVPAIKAGVKGAAQFALVGKAADLPTRAQRAIGMSAAMATPALIESKGNTAQTASAAVLGAAMGGLSKAPKGETSPVMDEAISAGKQLADNFKSVFDPQSREFKGSTAPPNAAAQTATVARAHLGEMWQKGVQVEDSLRKLSDFFDEQAPDPRFPEGPSTPAIDFMMAIRKGNVDQLPEMMQPFAKVVRDTYDNRAEVMQQKGILKSYVDNYFGLLWKRGGDNPDFQAIAKKPLEGQKGFAKQHVFDDVMEGLEYAQQNPDSGLQLAFNNPVDLVMSKVREMDKAIMAHDTLSEMRDMGLSQFVRQGTRAPDGWTQIDDKTSTVMFKDPRTDMWTLAGHWFSPEPAAKVINNYLSPGLGKNAAFRGYKLAANTMNQFQLGWSAFHLGFTTYDAMLSQFALSAEEAATGLARKDPALMAKAAGHALTAPFAAFEPIVAAAAHQISPELGKMFRSNQLMQEWRNPGSFPQLAPIVEYAKQAGARFELDPFYKNDLWRNMKQTYYEGNALGAALKLPTAITEQLAKPIMEYVVPRQKAAVFAKLTEFEVGKLGPNATQMQVRSAVQSAWNSVDNRMGQLVYDNLFWNRTAKDLAMTSIRSVGWNLGTWRELGGGMKDWANAVLNVTTGGRVGKMPEAYHRMAYAATLPVVTGLIGGITTYLASGQAPQSLTDLYFPKTGGTDEYGRPERISLPSYMKDVYHYGSGFGEGLRSGVRQMGKTVAGKMHPMIQLMADMYENSDWQGNKLWNEDDPMMKQLYGAVQHTGSQLMPFGLRRAIEDTVNTEVRGVPPRYGALERYAPFVGVTPAPADIKKTDAELHLDRNQNYRQGERTQQSATRFDRIAEMERALRKGDTASAELISQKAIASGEAPEGALAQAEKRAAEVPLLRKFKMASLGTALGAYARALPDSNIPTDQLAQIKELMQDKVDNKLDEILALPKDNTDRIKTMAQIRRLGLDTHGLEVETAPPPANLPR